MFNFIFGYLKWKNVMPPRKGTNLQVKITLICKFSITHIQIMTKLETHLPLFRGHILKSFGSIDFILHQLLSRTKQPPFSKNTLKKQKKQKTFFSKIVFFSKSHYKKILIIKWKKSFEGIYLWIISYAHYIYIRTYTLISFWYL